MKTLKILILIIFVFLISCSGETRIFEPMKTKAPTKFEIVYFKLDPEIIKPYQSTYISWKVEHANKVEIKTCENWNEVTHEGGWWLDGIKESRVMYLRADNGIRCVIARVYLTVEK